LDRDLQPSESEPPRFEVLERSIGPLPLRSRL
jgi:hypothetical protein